MFNRNIEDMFQIIIGYSAGEFIILDYSNETFTQTELSYIIAAK